MNIWYDDRFTQMKRSNAHEVTLGAVLGMLFMYLCPHLVRRQTLKQWRMQNVTDGWAWIKSRWAWIYGCSEIKAGFPDNVVS